MVELTPSDQLLSICSYHPDYSGIPNLGDLWVITTNRTEIEATQVRHLDNSVSACMHPEINMLFNKDLKTLSSLPEEKTSKGNKK